MAYSRARQPNAGRRYETIDGPQPMKGLHIPLTESVINWVQDALGDVQAAFSDTKAEEDAEEILVDLVRGTFEGYSAERSWQAAQDNFGKKAFTGRPIVATGQQGNEAELRVTVIIKKNGTMHLDVRPWGTY